MAKTLVLDKKIHLFNKKLLHLQNLLDRKKEESRGVSEKEEKRRKWQENKLENQPQVFLRTPTFGKTLLQLCICTLSYNISCSLFLFPVHVLRTCNHFYILFILQLKKTESFQTYCCVNMVVWRISELLRWASYSLWSYSKEDRSTNCSSTVCC